MKTVVSLFALACLVPALGQAGTIYVNGAAGNDAWSGACREWDGATCGPKQTIQAGIAAAVDGDTVLIADGSYAGSGNKNLEYVGKAITVRSENGPASCVIDCEDDGRGFYFHAGETAAARLEGVTITRGRIIGSNGSAISCRSASPTIINCVVRANYTRSGSGAVYGYRSAPVISGCIIEDNAGGGMTFDSGHPVILDSVIARNGSADSGIRCTDATISRCTISDNRAIYGGGVWCTDGSLTMTDCDIERNTAGNDGGGIYFSDCSARLENCTIMDNVADTLPTDMAAAGLCSRRAAPVLNSCIIAENRGAGVTCLDGGEPSFTACRIAGNSGIGVHVRGNPAKFLDCQIERNSEGGVRIYGAPRFVRCRIADNTLSDRSDGAGVCCEYGEPEIIACEISGNRATQPSARGGGMYCEGSPLIDSTLISGNSASVGAGICAVQSQAILNECTFTANVATTTGGGLSVCDGSAVSCEQCLFWGDRAPEGVELVVHSSSWLRLPSSLSLEWSDVQAGAAGAYVYPDCQLVWGPHMLDADPNFVDPDRRDFRLRPDSPCIDAGNPELNPGPGAVDCGGNRRIWDGDADAMPVFDIGAFEFASHPYGDVNCDDLLNTFDIDPFVQVLTDPAGYLAAFPGCDMMLADANADAALDVFDIDPFVLLLIGQP